VVVAGGSDMHVSCNIEEGAGAQVVHNMSGGGELHVTCNRCRGSGRRPDWRPDGAEEYEQLPPGLSFTS
jgi:DnaJ-class molecular chaperone